MPWAANNRKRRSIGITWKLVGNANSQAPLRTTESETETESETLQARLALTNSENAWLKPEGSVARTRAGPLCSRLTRAPQSRMGVWGVAIAWQSQCCLRT